VIVNTSARPRRVVLSAQARGPGSVQTLTGSSPRSVLASLDGQTLTLAGTWQGPRQVQTIPERLGVWTVAVPADSARLIALRHGVPRKHAKRASVTSSSER
jgi:hypothetical protein